jgi:hypothetical protein
MAPLEEIGQIRLELQNQLAKFEEDKAKAKGDGCSIFFRL